MSNFFSMPRRAVCALLRSACLGLLAVSGLVSAQTFSGAMSGAWWDAARDGEGFMIAFESIGTQPTATVAYFTFSTTGTATWLVGNGAYQPGAASVSISVVTASGPRFGAAFRSADIQRSSAGTVVLEYVSCTQLRMRYTGTESFTINLTRIVGPLTGVTCTSAPAPGGSAADPQLKFLLINNEVTGRAAAGRILPSISDPLPQLGKLLFFSKTLSGDRDTACASCHHPSLGGADGISFSIGAGAINPDVVGVGRRLPSGAFSVARNSNTFFNIGLLDNGLFWDSRVESIGKFAGQNGFGSAIRTPDTPPGSADVLAGATLPAAQARFPVVTVTEMRGNGLTGQPDSVFRNHLAARIGNYGSGAGLLASSQWLARFRTAFGNNGSAEQLITFDNIALAIAEYQRSATFVDSPFARYARGDVSAISEEAKEGALLFYRTTAQGGAQCAQCHMGDRFTDERHHAVGFPQIGKGMGDGVGGTDDFGRGRQSLQTSDDRYRFRTPSLLNAELTAPYGHAGAYRDLETTFAHYVVPDITVNSFLTNRQWCNLAQFAAITSCRTDFIDITRNTQAAMAKMAADRLALPTSSMPVVNPNLVTGEAIPKMVAFLRSLTDPCLKNRACFAPWIPSAGEAPDAHQLNAVDAAGLPR